MYAKRYSDQGDTKVMYSYEPDAIRIHPVWFNYLQKNCAVLKGFIYWELSRFLQKNNPNVIGITEKLKRLIHPKATAFQIWIVIYPLLWLCTRMLYTTTTQKFLLELLICRSHRNHRLDHS